MSYTRQYDADGRLTGVTRNADNSFVMKAADNRDWREFLEWNRQQRPPLDLSDLPPPPRRRPKTTAALSAEIATLPVAKQQELFMAVAARVLQQEPGFARALGVAIDGDEPA